MNVVQGAVFLLTLINLCPLAMAGNEKGGKTSETIANGIPPNMEIERSMRNSLIDEIDQTISSLESKFDGIKDRYMIKMSPMNANTISQFDKINSRLKSEIQNLEKKKIKL